jgi:hypothetical protein
MWEPLWRELASARHVLVAGCGGGYDVFSGLPLYFALQDRGYRVSLANLSFSALTTSDAEQLTPASWRVTADSQLEGSYFPEKHLAAWFRGRGEEVPVFALARTGARPLRAAYEDLVQRLDVDAILVVDGGTDSLMRGDEAGLGTPEEDAATLAAVLDLDVPTRLLVCLGFGVDRFHGVCHAQFLEAVAAVARARGYLGAFSLLPELPEQQLYREATEAVMAAMPPHNASIVCTSILDAIEGHYGDHHSTLLTTGSELWINPLMSLYWCFRLPAVAQRLLYLDALRETEDHVAVCRVIEEFRASCQVRPWEDMPT